MPASRAAASAAETPRAMSTPHTSPAKPGRAGSMGRMITELGMIGDIGVSPAGGAGPPRFCGNYSPGRDRCHRDARRLIDAGLTARRVDRYQIDEKTWRAREESPRCPNLGGLSRALFKVGPSGAGRGTGKS